MLGVSKVGYSFGFSGNVIGFTNLGEINTHLLDFERQVTDEACSTEAPAKTMMVFMVRGIFTSLQFPYVQFPVRQLTGDLLFDPFWDAVSRLERMGLKVCYAMMQTLIFVNISN